MSSYLSLAYYFISLLFVYFLTSAKYDKRMACVKEMRFFQGFRAKKWDWYLCSAVFIEPHSDVKKKVHSLSVLRFNLSGHNKKFIWSLAGRYSVLLFIYQKLHNTCTNPEAVCEKHFYWLI